MSNREFRPSYFSYKQPRGFSEKNPNGGYLYESNPYQVYVGNMFYKKDRYQPWKIIPTERFMQMISDWWSPEMDEDIQIEVTKMKRAEKKRKLKSKSKKSKTRKSRARRSRRSRK